MENVYTEKTLKSLNKAALLEIAAANEIEANDTMSNKDIMALILAKGYPLPDNGNGANKPPDSGETEPQNGGEPKFSKEQLLKSNWYSHRRDVLTTLLEDGKTYSHADVDKLIGDFMKGTVK